LNKFRIVLLIVHFPRANVSKITLSASHPIGHILPFTHRTITPYRHNEMLSIRRHNALALSRASAAGVGSSAELYGAATRGSVTATNTHHSDHSAMRADVPTIESIGNVTRSGFARYD
jgi:hypothetical protein